MGTVSMDRVVSALEKEAENLGIVGERLKGIEASQGEAAKVLEEIRAAVTADSPAAREAASARAFERWTGLAERVCSTKAVSLLTIAVCAAIGLWALSLVGVPVERAWGFVSGSPTVVVQPPSPAPGDTDTEVSP